MKKIVTKKENNYSVSQMSLYAHTYMYVKASKPYTLLSRRADTSLSDQGNDKTTHSLTLHSLTPCFGINVFVVVNFWGGGALFL